MTDREEGAEPSGSKPWPEELKLDTETSTLRIAFDNGEIFLLDAEYLRVYSPSAEVRGHGGSEKPLPPCGKKYVAVTDMIPIGNYAVRLVFDDGHETGLYSWDYLYELGSLRYKLWADYNERLAREGLSREPPEPPPVHPIR